ncbi:hypothetical protein [Aequorivita ciconiae]|uniref:hypothetical protein n=1 Tax=Aequorivita ciconiae TaxID=2494375 RepID=UPI0013E3D492|nr:hypothetical protein [Aequorivita sp. H23M31]
MKWIFENFKAELNNLTPEVREKALKIAEKIMEKGGVSEDEAIKKGIAKAQEWLYDSEG